jgi:hypothetical protein
MAVLSSLYIFFYCMKHTHLDRPICETALGKNVSESKSPRHHSQQAAECRSSCQSGSFVGRALVAAVMLPARCRGICKNALRLEGLRGLSRLPKRSFPLHSHAPCVPERRVRMHAAGPALPGACRPSPCAWLLLPALLLLLLLGRRPIGSWCLDMARGKQSARRCWLLLLWRQHAADALLCDEVGAPILRQVRAEHDMHAACDRRRPLLLEVRPLPVLVLCTQPAPKSALLMLPTLPELPHWHMSIVHTHAAQATEIRAATTLLDKHTRTQPQLPLM